MIAHAPGCPNGPAAGSMMGPGGNTLQYLPSRLVAMYTANVSSFLRHMSGSIR